MKLSKILRGVVSIFKEKRIYPVVTPVYSTQLLSDKVALISGGTGGIGKAIVKAFLESGCKVIIAGTNQSKLSQLCTELGANENVRSMVIDITDVSSLKDKINEACSKYGTIDILVNCAGIINKNTFFDITEDEYNSIMDINTKGVFFLCQAVAEKMIELGVKGHILNITSSSALRPAWTPYEMSKWAVRGFTIGLADSLIDKGIIVNAIGPGPVATPMLGKSEGDSMYKESSPVHRFAHPDEIASMAVFLCSSMGNYIVGDTVYMTGGSGIISLHR
ncbi:SDR family oxidoreductase [Butyrivibrio sp. X503]|uniref:SDR family NAD(P)-dependent oxidoreductase n=1 Tax=Butyrivibrio sp. X503 TaxID=2364878 RepID=UPI000EA8B60E|nr:SDR family oxidoreductase [Butyrivibrio sp. X503]RKM54470.1 SDR family oxidoreductase [Butyrivibrio sp. X503]